MKINYTGLASLGCLGVLFIITQGKSVDARALRTDDTQSHIIHKRNAWWSKKSVEGFDRIEKAHKQEEASRYKIGKSIDCYTDQCVSDFVWCGRQADDEADFLQCKLQHRMCASGCFGSNLTMP